MSFEQNLPRVIDTSNYVKDRIGQIAELLEVVDNSSLVAGEVTTGPRTILQRLPRHMRRRAMSHNIKRLPRAVQVFASKMMTKSKHRKKAPSRLWRRRPSNLLKNYIRRQGKQIWLETHIWHAKRFRMVPIWGYKLPWTSCQRSFRPNYRDSLHKALIMDQSFLHCFQIVTKFPELLIERLSCLCRPQDSVSFAFKPARTYSLETSILLFDNKMNQLLGPCLFSWHNTKDEETSLILWVHPIISESILANIIELLDLKRKECSDLDAQKLAWKSYSMYKLQSIKILTEIFENDQFQLLNLRDQLIRFSLVGPNSFSLLNSIVKLVPENEFPSECRTDQLSEMHNFWDQFSKHLISNPLRNGSIISLLVEDPRIFRAKKNLVDNINPQIRNVSLIPSPSTIFWDRKFRIEQLSKRLSTTEFDKMRANNLGVLKSTPFKIPLQMIIRNISQKGSTSTLSNGVDLILPAGTGNDFWVALQMAGARAIGLKDRMLLMFESDRFCFPADIPDSNVGKQYNMQENKSLLEKHNRRPHNRRVRYESVLNVKFPFSFEWPTLVADWTRDNIADDQVYVLRNRVVLTTIDSWLRGKIPRPDSILQKYRAALIPIKLEAIKSGCPKRLGLICFPTLDDLNRLKENPKAIIEESNNLNTPNGAITSDEDEKVHLEKSKRSFPEFISLDITKKEKVSLNEMFPETKSIQETKKRKKEASKKRVKQKKHTLENFGNEASQFTSDEDEKLNSYYDSCSRMIIGRIVRGDFSFSKAKGSAIGYCVLESLMHINSRMVLFRNCTSKYYHPANFFIHTHPTVL